MNRRSYRERQKRSVALRSCACTMAIALVFGAAGCASSSEPAPDTTEPDSAQTIPDSQPGTDTSDAITRDKTQQDAPFPSSLFYSAEKLHDLLDAGQDTCQVVDIRSYADYSAEHIAGSVNIPGGRQFELRINEIDTQNYVILVSNSSYDNVAAALSQLDELGMTSDRLGVLQGGIQAWINAQYPVEVDPDNHC